MILELFMLIVILAMIIESLIEKIKEIISPKKAPKWVWFIAASIIGIAGCIFFDLNIFEYAGFNSSYVVAAAWFGYVITGMAIGSGSGFVHKIIGFMDKPKV